MSAVIDTPRNILGQPITTVPEYRIDGISPDIAMGLLRKPLTIEERWLINFGTAMPKDKTP